MLDLRESAGRLCTALRFLTVLPVPWFAENDANRFRESEICFALVGVLIGLLGAGLVVVLSGVLPSPVLSCVVVFYLSGISGFLHLDGLADTADGFLSYRPRETILTIMRDSRTGAMGVIVIVFLLLFKFAAISALPSDRLAAAVFFLSLGGRSVLVFLAYLFPYARKEGGLGNMFHEEKKRSPSICALGIFVLSGLWGPSLMAFVTFLSVLVITFVFGRWCQRIIGGITGDTLGAACEITETFTVLLFAILFNSST